MVDRSVLTVSAVAAAVSGSHNERPLSSSGTFSTVVPAPHGADISTPLTHQTLPSLLHPQSHPILRCISPPLLLPNVDISLFISLTNFLTNVASEPASDRKDEGHALGELAFGHGGGVGGSRHNLLHFDDNRNGLP